jgi:Lon protease-like protein
MNISGLPADFGGTVRLFPLPNLVLFPHVGQPLHIFEPRYRQLMEDALEDDRLIATVLLRPGWEEDYHKRPAIHDIICIGRILNEERLSDGRYNFILQGLARGRILEELKVPKLYRVARIELVEDVDPNPSTQTRLVQELAQRVTPFFRQHPVALQQMQQLIASQLGAGPLCDIFSFALPLPVERRQTLLDEADVETRAELLLGYLQDLSPPAAAPGMRKFPPDFSEN